MDIKKLSKQIHSNARKKGFWDKKRNFGELLMLVTSELGECIEAHRKGKSARLNEFEKQLKQKPAPFKYLVSASGRGPNRRNKYKTHYFKDKDWFDICFVEHVKDRWQDEIADAIIRLLDMAEGYGVDIEKHISLKMKYNSNRNKLHGKKY